MLNSNTKHEVTMMVCKFCFQFKDKILSCKNFQPEWAGDGCKHLQLYAARGHAESDQHKKACDLYLKEEGCSISERSALTKKLDKDQAVLIDRFQKMSEVEKSALMKKINVTYFVVKEEMVFTKYNSNSKKGMVCSSMMIIGWMIPVKCLCMQSMIQLQMN